MAKVTFWFLLYAAYGSWFFCFLASIFGACKTLPIASVGYTAAPWQQAIVQAGLALVAITITLATCFILYGMRKAKAEVKA
jgi:hypothetical protein